NVRNSLLITSDHDLGSFGHSAAIVAACPANTTRAHLRINQFARAAFANRHAKSAKHAHHFEVGGVQVLLVGYEDSRKKKENDCSTNESNQHGQRQSRTHP